MARKRKAKQKVDPVTQEIIDLLHGNNSDVAVDVVTAEYKVQVQEPTPVLEPEPAPEPIPEPTPKLTNKALAAANAWLKERGFR